MFDLFPICMKGLTTSFNKNIVNNKHVIKIFQLCDVCLTVINLSHHSIGKQFMKQSLGYF